MESDAASFVLGDENFEFLRIRALYRLHPHCADYWDGNWLRAEAEVIAGAFRGRLEGDLRTDEFARFHEDLVHLHELLKGTAELAAMEAWLTIRVVGDGRGHLDARCTLRDELVRGNTLEARFHFDQTFLPPLLRQLAGVLEAFPVIGRADA